MILQKLLISSSSSSLKHQRFAVQWSFFSSFVCRQQQRQPQLVPRGFIFVVLGKSQDDECSVYRSDSYSGCRCLSSSSSSLSSTEAAKPTVALSFVQPDGVTVKEVRGTVGESLLRIAQRNDIDLEGACEGVCACSTCHLIFPMDVYDSLPEPSEDEEDMLDMAFGLTETSRLGCQVIVTEDMDGMVIQMPAATRNFYVDGHVPKPH